MGIEHKVLRTRYPLTQEQLDKASSSGWEFVQTVSEEPNQPDAGFVHYFKTTIKETFE